MMEAQLHARRGHVIELAFGRPVTIGQGGELSVLRGSVWLTRRGDPQDHLLSAGQRICLAADAGAVLERLHRDEDSAVAWKPGVSPPRR